MPGRNPGCTRDFDPSEYGQAVASPEHIGYTGIGLVYGRANFLAATGATGCGSAQGVQNMSSASGSAPKWLSWGLLVAAAVIVLFGGIAWSAEYRVQSAGLFAFGILFAIQGTLLLNKAKQMSRKG